jgi:hypothetical protein
LAKGALCLSRPLCDLVERDGGPDKYSEPNLKDVSRLADILKSIELEKERERIVDLTCENRYKAFNLRRLIDGFDDSVRTIEVRRMHGAINAKDAWHWIAMAISIVHLMLESEIVVIPSRDDFKDKIHQAAVALGVESWLNMDRCLRYV